MIIKQLVRYGLIFSIFFIGNLYGSNTLDSLQNRLRYSKNEKQKIAALFQIGKYYQNHDYKLKHAIGNQILHLSDSLHYPKGRAMGLIMLGEGYMFESKEYKSIVSYTEALEIAEGLKDDTLISECLNVFFYFHYDNNQIELAKNVLQRKLKIDSAFTDLKYKAQNHDFIGLVCEYEGQYDSAKYHYQQAFNYALEAKDSVSASTFINNIAVVFALEGDYKAAIELHKYVVGIKMKMDDKYTMGFIKSLIAQNYLKLNQLDSAYKYAHQALSIRNDIYIIVKKNAFGVLYQIYKQRGQFQKSLSYLEQLNIVQDSLSNQAKTNALANIQYNLEVEKKNKAIAIKELEIKNKDNILFGVVGGLIVVCVFAVMLVINVRENNKLNKILAKQKEELYEQNQEIESQNEEITAINQHQEEVIEQRTYELKESEALLKMSQKLAKLGSWVLDVETGALKCSGELTHIFNLPESKTPNLKILLSLMRREDVSILIEHVNQAVQHKLPFEVEFPVCTYSKQEKWLHIIGIPVLSPKDDNHVVEVMGCVQDITERKQAENVVLEQAEELIQTNKKAAEFKLMALRSVMNPHFLFNSLNSIQYFIAKNIREEALDYLSQFSKLIRLVLNSSISNTVTLADEIEALRLYSNLEAVRFENFDTVFDIDDDIDIHNIFIPSLLLQPYVENAILHGLSKRPDKLGLLKIHFHYNQNDHLVCVVDDNGIGRAESQKVKEGDTKLHRSVGMLVTSERLELINQNEQVGVKITDKTDEQGNPTGTRVEITIQLNDG